MIALARKYCKGCNQDKPLSEFAKCERYSMGRYWQCKECCNIRKRASYVRRQRIPGTPTKTAQKTQSIDLGLALLSAVAKPEVELTLEDIAAWCDCSRELVRQIEASALRKVRAALMRRGEWDEVQGAFRAAFCRREMEAKAA